MKDYKIAEDVAQIEFDRFVDLMDLDISDDFLDNDEKKDLAELKRKFTTSVQKGELLVLENGEVSYTPQRSEDKTIIVFSECTGAALQAMDRRKKSEDTGKLFAAMGSITHTSAATFSKMKMYDLKVCMAVTTLLMG